MIPLTLANVGDEYTVRKIGGSPEVKKHLENLGFVAGSNVIIVTEMAGNLVVKVKEARVAVSRELAQKIMI
ncbi:MAG: ferrous iron transport protein A [Oscillibacter sp.]|nr:ferrous iron transport protein A [Oscillibacter sp.]